MSEERALADDLIGDADISALSRTGFPRPPQGQVWEVERGRALVRDRAGRMLRAPTVFEDVVKTI